MRISRYLRARRWIKDRIWTCREYERAARASPHLAASWKGHGDQWRKRLGELERHMWLGGDL